LFGSDKQIHVLLNDSSMLLMHNWTTKHHTLCTEKTEIN
jgi:hypothetical protein